MKPLAAFLLSSLVCLPSAFAASADITALLDLAKYQAHAVAAQRTGEETRGDVKTIDWKLRVGDTWAVSQLRQLIGKE